MTRPVHLIVALLVALVLAGGASSAQAAPTATDGGGFSQVAGCISGADNLLVSIVVDESLSLRSTDPRALRVEGINTAIDSLEQLTETVADSTNVEVSLSTFARSFETLAGWQELTPRAGQQLRDRAEQALPARDGGDATDYRQALLGAKGLLDTRQRELEDPNACKLLLWFTDGALDVDAQTDLARQELCQPGGIADAVRDDGIAVVALALFTPGAGVTEPQRDELRSVAEGSSAQATCGTTPVPSDSATGVYLPADDPAALQRLFAGAGALVAGGTEIGTVECPGSDCPDGVYQLDLDPGVAGARVLVQTAGDPGVVVRSPSGQTVDLSSGTTQQVDGAEVSYLVRNRLATVNISYSPYTENRSGWHIEPQGPAELSVYWFWGAGLELETPEIKAGERNEIRLQVQDQHGDRLPSNLYRDADVSLSVGEEDVEAQLTPDGMIHGELDLGVEDLPANLSVRASMSVRSVPSGVTLGPIALNERVPVALPPSYPTIRPQELDFGHLEGAGTVRTELAVTGSQLGPTQVCVTGSSIAVPGEEAASDLVRADPECAELAADETRTLTLELSPETSVDGVADGEVTLQMSAADDSEDLQVAVPTRLEMEREVDEGTRWALIVALLALALLVPALLLVGSNLLLARFAMSSLSRTATKSVRVTRAGLQPLDGGALLEPEDFTNASFSGVRKGGRLPVEGTGLTLRGRRIFSLKEPVGVAEGPAGRLLVSSAMPYRCKAVNEAPVTFGEVDATFVVLDTLEGTPDEARGTLIMVVPEGVDRQGIHDRAARMSTAPGWEDRLAELAEMESTSSGSDPGPPADHPQASDDTAAEPDVSDRPPLPSWGDDTGTTAPPSTQPSGKRSRLPRRRRSAPPPPAQSPRAPSSASDDDDTLPPLPDFLK